MENEITRLFTTSGMSIREFSNKTGIKYNTARDIVNGVTKVENIGAGSFVKIAHVFDMSADELLSRATSTTYSIVDLDEANEQYLLELYRALDGDTQKLVLDLLERLAK